MPTQAKAAKIEEITDKLGRSTIAILVQTQGLNVKGMNDFRGKLRAAKIDLQVVKNTLLRIASERNSMSLDRKLFDGQTTVAFGYEDEVTAVKAVSDYVRTSKIVTIKSAILGSRTLSQKQVEDLSKISGGKNQAKAEVVGILQAPLTNIYSTLTAPLRDLCYVLQARADQLNSGQAAE
ncbi:MAG TPA: 50S ribosomal protein L10 [Ktedonobacteraceae bacterium]|jgi:large subunit ribosomal protein L10|nr:50S ribosomal protein L10 [Ktedonobacteraceae bacterium]